MCEVNGVSDINITHYSDIRIVSKKNVLGDRPIRIDIAGCNIVSKYMQEPYVSELYVEFHYDGVSEIIRLHLNKKDMILTMAQHISHETYSGILNKKFLLYKHMDHIELTSSRISKILTWDMCPMIEINCIVTCKIKSVVAESKFSTELTTNEKFITDEILEVVPMSTIFTAGYIIGELNSYWGDSTYELLSKIMDVKQIATRVLDTHPMFTKVLDNNLITGNWYTYNEKKSQDETVEGILPEILAAIKKEHRSWLTEDYLGKLLKIHMFMSLVPDASTYTSMHDTDIVEAAFSSGALNASNVEVKVFYSGNTGISLYRII